MTEAEVNVILADDTKRIDGDLSWRQQDDQPYAVIFRAEVQSEAGYPLFVSARYNSMLRRTVFSLIHRGAGCILRLCVGKGHHNPTCENTSDTHLHRWEDAAGDKIAMDVDVAAAGDDPVQLWNFFCERAGIRYSGTLGRPPAIQWELFG